MPMRFGSSFEIWANSWLRHGGQLHNDKFAKLRLVNSPRFLNVIVNTSVQCQRILIDVATQLFLYYMKVVTSDDVRSLWAGGP